MPQNDFFAIQTSLDSDEMGYLICRILQNANIRFTYVTYEDGLHLSFSRRNTASMYFDNNSIWFGSRRIRMNVISLKLDLTNNLVKKMKDVPSSEHPDILHRFLGRIATRRESILSYIVGNVEQLLKD